MLIFMSKRFVFRARHTGWARRWWVVGTMAGAIGCGGLTGEGDLPPGVQDPANIRTPSGTMGYYRGTLETFGKTADLYVIQSGEFTDELMALPSPLGVVFNPTDSRQAPAAPNTYQRLHMLRAQAREVRGFLGAFTPDSSSALTGHMYAAEGYADLYLADLFCSGVPLSTVDFDGDFTLSAARSTADVYAAALEFFDSAAALSSDSVALRYLAAVGRGRALLALGRYADAAVAVTEVPDDFAYRVLQAAEVDRDLWDDGHYGNAAGELHMADDEGGTGLDYRSSADPRTAAQFLRVGLFDNEVYFPAKYPTRGAISYIIASGIEARLIEAEAALDAQAYGTWLAKLNHLRQTMWPSIVPAASGPLDELEDPGSDVNGTDVSRQNLLFRERAFWLYLTGHRAGDLRRLVRQYQRVPSTVYPTGFYPGGSGAYGEAVVVPVPFDEIQKNPWYTGCLHGSA